ncbi:MAG: hypothetical protein ACEPOW_03635 [Bacteroidales bacterium]
MGVFQEKQLSRLTIKWLIFIISSIVFFIISKPNIPKYTGDSLDYIAMTESWKNHLSPEIQIEDVISTNKIQVKYFNGRDILPENPEYWKMENFMDHYWVYYGTGNGKAHNQHFWFYSLIITPFYICLSYFNLCPLLAFSFTTFFLLLGFIYFILFKSKFNTINAVFVICILFFSSYLWYSRTIHTEAYTMILVTWSMILYFEKKHYSSLFLASIAAIQNPPLIILAGFIYGEKLIREKFKLSSIIKLSVCSAIGFITYAFYLIEFHMPSIISDQGIFIENFNFRRFLGVFFDLDQGMIYSIPIILPLFILVYCIELFKAIKLKQLKFHFFIPLVISIICLGFMGMFNWNHGMLIISRYTVWLSAIIFIYFIFLTLNKKYFKYLMIPILASQIFIAFYFGGTYPEGWGVERKPLSDYMLKKHPKYYNPDWQIFQARSIMKWDKQPFVPLLDDDGVPYKIGFTKGNEDKAAEYGYSKEQIEKFKRETKFYANYGYINETPAFPEIAKNRLLKTTIKFNIDQSNGEHTPSNYMEYIANNRNSVSTEKAFVGKKSFKISQHSRYFYIFDLPIKKEGIVVFSAWINETNDKTSLVVNNNNLWNSNNSSLKEKDEWHKKELRLKVNPNMELLKFSFDTPQDEDIFIDNIEIDYIKNNQQASIINN